MYTRCPHCQTVFSLTPTQLKARDGLVRCGRCGQKFQADHALLDGPLQAVATPAPGHRGTDRANGTTRTRKRRERRARAEPAVTTRGAKPAPVVTAQPARTRAIFWWLGNILLVAVLAAQGVYFYGDALVELEPALKPAVTEFCDFAGCQLRPRQDVTLIDLADAQVEPHPRFDRALRVHAVLVNRAEFAQPHPRLEITLTDREGKVVARRSFSPAEYLPRAAARADAMAPGVAVDVQLDVTQPEARTTGYEIRLLPAR